MGVLGELLRSIHNPKLLLRKLNRLYHRAGLRRRYNPDGVDIMQEDWDNLIILDACRYDVFEETSSLEGDLNPEISRGSSTVEFLFGNFLNKDLQDTVYVTSNPQYRRYKDALGAEFHEVIDVWRAEGWDEEYKTVLPETTAEFANETAAGYPNKRLIIHYVQPHYPFIARGDQQDAFTPEQAFLQPGEPGSWTQILTGEVDVERAEVWKAYRRNLELALSSVEELLSALQGKTVVTADHGNAIGDRSFPIPVTEWGHPPGIYIEELVKVPWLVCDSRSRREIVSDPPQSDTAPDTGTVSDRLEALGYH